MKYNFSEMILYEDNHLLVVHKPANLLSQEDNTKDLDLVNLAKAFLKVKYNKPGNVYVGLVHRLDRMTEGILVLAKTSKAAGRLSEQIRNQEWIKEYVAVVEGEINDTRKLTHYINHIDNTKKMTQAKYGEGQKAELFFDVLAKNDRNTVVSVKLITGRHHQIRVQFSLFGHPLIGDMLYGTGKKHDLMLCCYKLTIKHPITNEVMTFETTPKNKVWNKYLDIKLLNTCKKSINIV